MHSCGCSCTIVRTTPSVARQPAGTSAPPQYVTPAAAASTRSPPPSLPPSPSSSSSSSSPGAAASTATKAREGPVRCALARVVAPVARSASSMRATRYGRSFMRLPSKGTPCARHTSSVSSTESAALRSSARSPSASATAWASFCMRRPRSVHIHSHRTAGFGPLVSMSSSSPSPSPSSSSAAARRAWPVVTISSAHFQRARAAAELAAIERFSARLRRPSTRSMRSSTSPMMP